jgi:hypothetical protein
VHFFVRFGVVTMPARMRLCALRLRVRIVMIALIVLIVRIAARDHDVGQFGDVFIAGVG